jgi:hypothetical protein
MITDKWNVILTFGYPKLEKAVRKRKKELREERLLREGRKENTV